MRLYAPLPFLLWATVRFGTQGIALSLLTVTGLAIGTAAYGTGPFVTQSPAQNLLSLELFLMGISVPLLTLAALIEERQQQETALRQAQTELARVSRVMTVGELAASISHEVNQPLCALVANAAACRRWLSNVEPDLKEAREAVDEIVRDATRANEVIVRIRTLVKKEAVAVLGAGPGRDRAGCRDAPEERSARPGRFRWPSIWRQRFLPSRGIASSSSKSS